MVKYWAGDPPRKCDTCSTPIDKIFYDAKTQMGPWGFMCPSCQKLGPGFDKLGLGWGQEYTKQPDGKWMKTGG